MSKKRMRRCVICGKRFEGTRRAIYCGDNCKHKAYGLRKRTRAEGDNFTEQA